MAASTTNLRNPVKRFHSIDRQKEYVTPSKRDVLCPYFPKLFAKTGKADVNSTYSALCDTGDVACDYREERAGLHLCKRYWADPTFDLELVKRTPTVDPPLWQDAEVVFNYERPFKKRIATVLMAISRLIPVQVDMGNFLRDWLQWNESDSGDWYQEYNSTSKRDEVLNRKNQGGRSFWFNPNHMHLKNYSHEYYVQARGGDDDTYGSVFRFNGTSYYSFEWDSGGMGINGMALFRNVFNGSNWIKTRLAHSSVRWGSGSRYIHKVHIQAINNRISIEVHRMSGANLVKIATLEYFDIDPFAPKEGAWGPVTQSQPDTYFWDLRYSMLELLSASLTPELQVEIPLSYKQASGGLHMVSEPLSHYFTNDIYDKALKRNGITNNDVGLVEYWIQSTNVHEGVIFSTAGTMPQVTTDMNAKIAMQTFNYDAAIKSFVGNIYAPIRDSVYNVLDISNIDKQVTSIYVRPLFTRIFDTVGIEINGRTVRYMSGIEYGEHVVELKPPVQLEVGDTVSVTYYANDFEMEYYKGDYVDTHNKIFKIEGNKLHWHHIPSYVAEEDT